MIDGEGSAGFIQRSIHIEFVTGPSRITNSQARRVPVTYRAGVDPKPQRRACLAVHRRRACRGLNYRVVGPVLAIDMPEMRSVSGHIGRGTGDKSLAKVASVIRILVDVQLAILLPLMFLRFYASNFAFFL